MLTSFEQSVCDNDLFLVRFVCSTLLTSFIGLRCLGIWFKVLRIGFKVLRIGFKVLRIGFKMLQKSAFRLTQLTDGFLFIKLFCNYLI